MFLLNLYPIYFGFIIIFVVEYFNLLPSELKIEKFDLIISSIITVCITIIGFFITIIAILIGLIQRRIMRFLIKHKGERLLTQLFILPILFSALIILYSFYLSISVNNNCLSKTQSIVLLFLFIVFTISVWRIGSTLLAILSQIPGEYNREIIDKNNISTSNPDDAF